MNDGSSEAVPITQHVKYKPYNSKRGSTASIHSINSINSAATAPEPQPPVASPPANSSPQGTWHRHRPSMSDHFVRSNSAPVQSSPNASPVASGSALASPSPLSRKNGIPTIVTPSPLATGASSPGSSGTSTPTKRPIHPAQNSLDRFPRSPPSSQRAFLPSVSPNGSSALPTDYFHATHSSLSSMIAGKPRSTTPVQTPPPGKTPYLPGFQPQGVYRVRTEELVKSRASKGEAKRLESGRINRRLEKLVNLHFPDPASSPTTPTINRSSSNITLKDLASPRSVSAGDLWSTVRRSVQGQGARRADLIRTQEQTIVHWEEDREVSSCPLCSIPFSLTIRKHHCRLCGRIVCFVPPNVSPGLLGRNERCSTFVSYQWEAGDGRLVELEDSLDEEMQSVREKEGVRVCKECLNVVMHHQSANKPSKQPTWLKLHDVLMQIQSQIDAALPAFQEEILSSSTSLANLTPSQRNALLSSRKKLLSLLASFDSLSKKIRDLPTDAKAPNGAQDRLQTAIANRAALYLQEKMGLLKGLGSFDDMPPAEPKSAPKQKRLRREASGRTAEEQMAERQEIEERAAKLTVLIEQERLVAEYLAQANAKRQLVDAASLKISLEELQNEIAAEKDFLGLS